MTSPSPSSTPKEPAQPDEQARPVPSAAPLRPQAVAVTDRLESRIRKPVDLLRCIICCVEIVLLSAIGVLASATSAGVETDIVAASRRLPYTAFTTARSLTLFALLILPVALVIQDLVRRQGRRLWEAAGTGILAAAAVGVTNSVLRGPGSEKLYHAITMTHATASRTAAPLDGYLAGLIAYATMIGFARRTRWQTAIALIIVAYALVNLAALQTTVLSLLITLLAGRAVGLAVRYAAGALSLRPSAEQIAAALNTMGCRLAEMRRGSPAGSESRYYAATARGGGQLDIYVYDQDQQAAGAFYRLYRMVRLQVQVAHRAPLSVDRLVERRALLSYAAENTGTPTPRLTSLVRAGPEAVALAYEHHDGVTLAERGEPTDAELRTIWDAVRELHAGRVTHGTLTADRILLTSDGGALLLDTSGGEVAATDLEIRLDLVQFVTELALCAGPDRTAELVVSQLGPREVAALVPLLQTVVLAAPTKAALSRRKEVLPALRKELLATVPGGEVAPVRLERIRLRTLVTLVATVLAAYLLAGELVRTSLASVLRTANWWWGVPGIALSALTYVGATMSLKGFVTERLGFARTLLAQLASSFVTLVTPAAVGGAALNIRYLQRRKVPAAVAVASVGVAQVAALIVHVLLLVVFVAVTGTSRSRAFTPPSWVYFVLAGVAALALAVLAFPAGRRLLRARVAPTLGEVVPHLLQLAQQPRKLAQGVGGALLLSASYILCLYVCVRALGGVRPVATVAVIYLTGSAVGSLVPTPGGLGAVETVLSAGLVATGLPYAVAVSSVLLFRLMTFWLPVPLGWAALRYLERADGL